MSSLYDSTIERIEEVARLVNLDPDVLEELRYPKRVIEVAVPVKMDSGKLRVFQGWRVQYNDRLGPFKGGVRFHEKVSLDELKALAAWMTLKTAIVGIPMGGGKGGVIVNPKGLSEGELERLSRGFMRALCTCLSSDVDILAPDVNTNPKIMAWMADEYAKATGNQDAAVVTGKPVEQGGSLGRDTATGKGGAIVLREVIKRLGKKPQEMTVAIQGFGNVGLNIAKYLYEDGFKIVSLSDSKGALAGAGPLNPYLVEECKREKGLVAGCYCVGEVCDFSHNYGISLAEQLELDVDVLIPAALENQITMENVKRIRARVILEMANGPITYEASRVLHEREVTVIPDILANAGGVTVSYFEWLQNKRRERWSEAEVFKKLDKRLVEAFNDVEEKRRRYNVDMRTGAYVLALERIEAAVKKRGA